LTPGVFHLSVLGSDFRLQIKDQRVKSHGLLSSQLWEVQATIGAGKGGMTTTKVKIDKIKKRGINGQLSVHSTDWA
jgi:hypothetical protein